MTLPFIRIALLGLLLAPLAGCTSLNYAAGPQKPILANRVLVRPYKITSEFKEKGRRVYVFWGLLPCAGDDGDDLIAARMALGDGIVDLTAQEHYSFVDNLLALVTAGFVRTRSVEIHGDIFTYETAPPPPALLAPPPAEATPTPSTTEPLPTLPPLSSFQ